MQYENFIRLFENSTKNHWSNPALSEFRKSTLTYEQLAGKIESLTLFWEKIGLQKGDKIAINAKSGINTSIVYMAAVCNGYVAVQMFNGFTPGDVMNLVNHSESKVVYTDKRTFDGMDITKMPQVLYVADAATNKNLATQADCEEISESYAAMSQLLASKYPQGMKPEDVKYDIRDWDELCAIMYTSGSTGNPKGVMLTIKNFSSNVLTLTLNLPIRDGEGYLSVLPHAHIFGLVCDLMIPLCYGMHLTILGVPPIPANVKDALSEVKPRLFFGVPLVFIKYIDYIIGSDIKDPEGAEKLKNYESNPEFCQMLHDKLLASMGGNIEMFCTGGAAIPFELEALLMDKLKVPFVSGYGLTETSPLVSIGVVGDYLHRSCGKYESIFNELRIDSPDPAHIAGEVLFRGAHVFAGYYKNPEETAAVITKDGWFHTGDMGTVDENKNLFLVGRCKNMILSTNGQNIYPEEIEVVLNALPYISESIIVQRKSKLVALIVVNVDAASNDNLNADALDEIMKQNIAKLNTMIPAYSAVNGFELRFEPFVKTPKGSIRRFMYR